ncbi:MAG TPA: YpdA family putative bacillithiol disulfide reductase [Thermoanaerobaculia bacterium]|nr:YpdA family putative bacillithiol disulfide reductase [Thermoanaerobaculia bacterium]HTR04300.1 YpdA family putative bacillithiol disulfide reductase [Thermoanaerobaculia bacterium]
MPSESSPVAIVGAGPTGIACAVELQRRDIPAVCYEKAFLLHSIYQFPEEMRWYSTRDLLDIAGVPFSVPDAHPTRLETLAYYRGVAERFGVMVVPETEIRAMAPRPGGGLEVEVLVGSEARSFFAPAGILATGFFHNPRRLGVPGDQLSHVHSRYVSGYPFHGRDVVVVGGKNSACEAALDLYRHGARVTLLVRAPALSDRVKYWIKPDLENRIRSGAIRALFSARVVEITPGTVLAETPEGRRAVEADAVFPLIGYEPDFSLFERCGVRLEGPLRVPAHDADTLESNVPNLYLAGAILGGSEIGRIFIENSRHHAGMIASSIERKRRLVTA